MKKFTIFAGIFWMTTLLENGVQAVEPVNGLRIVIEMHRMLFARVPVTDSLVKTGR